MIGRSPLPMPLKKSGFIPAVIALFALAFAQPAAAADSSLSSAMDNCWDAVELGGLAPVSKYKMEFESAKNTGTTAEYNIWRGLAGTEFGEIELRVKMRNWIIFECSLATFPFDTGPNSVEFTEATDVLWSWYGARLRKKGYFETLTDVRFFGLVRCVRDKLVITSSAQSVGLFNPEILKTGRDEPIPGPLNVAIFRTSPRNFDFCAGSGAL